MHDLDTLKAEIMSIPMIDGHCHATFPGIWKYADLEPIAYTSHVAEALTDLDGVSVFRSAGMPQSEQNDIRYGRLDREQSIKTLLRYMDDVKVTNHVVFVRKGLELCYGVRIPSLTYENLLAVDEAADLERRYDVLFDRGNMKRVMLNMWNTLGISYYGEYLANISEDELRADRRCNARIATFDYHSTPPFSERTHRFARLCGCDYENFDEYDAFLERLAEFYVKEREVVGFKFSEAYFRALDYRPVKREDAKAAYKENMTDAEKRTLADYVSLKIMDMARSYGIPVQFHTGELWGSTDMAIINPLNIEPTVKLFPDLRFDLLHCGYPFTSETGILLDFYKNVYVNINPRLVSGYEFTKVILDQYLNIGATSHILLGMDMFTPEATIGGAYYTRLFVAEVMCDRVRRELLGYDDALECAHKLLHGNDERLYGLE